MDGSWQAIDIEQVAESGDVHVELNPNLSGLNGIEIRINTHAPDGFPIEWTALLNIEAQPRAQKTVMEAATVVGAWCWQGWKLRA